MHSLAGSWARSLSPISPTASLPAMMSPSCRMSLTLWGYSWQWEGCIYNLAGAANCLSSWVETFSATMPNCPLLRDFSSPCVVTLRVLLLMGSMASPCCCNLHFSFMSETELLFTGVRPILISVSLNYSFISFAHCRT